jgi:endonuclease/exonuclease/phosphatase family metal-dependent hydrolase
LDLNIPVILGGDLNIDMLGNQCGHLEDILTRLNLENVVWEPTHITHTSATCIHLFITNRPNLILDIKVPPNFCSDHCPVSVDINIKTSKEQCYKRTIRK